MGILTLGDIDRLEDITLYDLSLVDYDYTDKFPFSGVATFSSEGTHNFTIPLSAENPFIGILAISGGAGGGGGNTGGGGGGGGAGTCNFYIYQKSFLPAELNITVGAGGAGGQGGESVADGNNGEITSIEHLFTINGGLKGNKATATVSGNGSGTFNHTGASGLTSDPMNGLIASFGGGWGGAGGNTCGGGGGAGGDVRIRDFVFPRFFNSLINGDSLLLNWGLVSGASGNVGGGAGGGAAGIRQETYGNLTYYRIAGGAGGGGGGFSYTGGSGGGGARTGSWAIGDLDMCLPWKNGTISVGGSGREPNNTNAQGGLSAGENYALGNRSVSPSFTTTIGVGTGGTATTGGGGAGGGGGANIVFDYTAYAGNPYYGASKIISYAYGGGGGAGAGNGSQAGGGGGGLRIHFDYWGSEYAYGATGNGSQAGGGGGGGGGFNIDGTVYGAGGNGGNTSSSGEDGTSGLVKIFY